MASGFGRFIAFLVLVGLLAVSGVTVYNAGVAAGINSDIGQAIASGAAIPAGYYSGAYWGHPGGFGFGGFLIGIVFLFLFFGLLRAIFGFGRWGHHGGGGYSKFGRHGGWNEYMGSWHDEQHGKAPSGPAPDKT
ncbi:MAG: hypothetical protein ABI864_05620 [Chloroflexota bacterium]